MDKALEAYLKAEEHYGVDFPLQLQIGKLYLYACNEGDDFKDLRKAERHLLLAARYANADKATEPCGQAYFHAAVAAYLIGEQEEGAGSRDRMRSCLERALGYLTKTEALWPRFTEIVYTQAKCHALLGQTHDATRKLEILSDRDRRYFEKASRDGDFKSFFADIGKLFRHATVSPGPLARATQVKLDVALEALAWAKRSIPASEEDLAVVDSVVTDPSAARYIGVDATRLNELPNRQKIAQAKQSVEAMARELSLAKISLPTLEVDIEGLNERLTQIWAELEKLAAESFKGMSDACDQVFSSLQQRKAARVHSIQEEKERMKYTSGSGMGCLFFFLFYSGAAVGMSLLFTLAPQVRGNGTDVAWAFGLLGIGIVGAVIGSKISRHHKNQPHRLKIEEYSGMIAECVRKLPGVKARAEAWKEEMQKFAAWQNRRSSPPSPRF